MIVLRSIFIATGSSIKKIISIQRGDYMIPHSRPTIEPDDIEAVTKVMRSQHVALGPRTREFEIKLSKYIDVKDAVATSSGTTALHLALASLDIGKGDEVMVPTGICPSVIYCIHYCGAKPILVDINLDDHNISIEDARKRITRKTGAIIAAHMYGAPADLDALKEFDVPLIEDCAHAIGGTYRGKKLGSIGDAAIFSFYATKMLTTGEGGMVTFKSKKALDRARGLREYKLDKIYRLRYNYKMTDMQAAMGIVQLKKLPGFIKKRRELAKAYDREFSSIPATLPELKGRIFYRYIMMLEKSNVNTVLKDLEKRGVAAVCPVQAVHRSLKLKGFKNAEKLMRTALSIPIYPSLTKKELNAVVKAVKTEVR
jgi:dTDP-4-amino-4,6-dideoxygalactose transaminase